jgi:hypothetical protein
VRFLIHPNAQNEQCKCDIYLFIHSRHLQRFWGVSGNIWQALWDRLLDVIGEDLFTLWVYGMYIPCMM